MSKNFAYSTVATAPSPATSGTSLVVAAGTGSRFYVGKAFVAPASSTPTPANSEVVSITAISTDTLTITRAAESSTARTIVAGDLVYQGITAADWDALPATYAPLAKGLTATAKTTTYTAAVGDYVQADATSAGFTVTLPAAPGVGGLVQVRKVDSSSNIVTVVATGGGTVDGDASATILTQWAGGTFQHVGSNIWQIVAVTGSRG